MVVQEREGESVAASDETTVAACHQNQLTLPLVTTKRIIVGVNSSVLISHKENGMGEFAAKNLSQHKSITTSTSCYQETKLIVLPGGVSDA